MTPKQRELLELMDKENLEQVQVGFELELMFPGTSYSMLLARRTTIRSLVDAGELTWTDNMEWRASRTQGSAERLKERVEEKLRKDEERAIRSIMREFSS
jgi:hypothetical protein